MPEGDTLFRAAAGLRPYLVGRTVTGARARQPGPKVEQIVGAAITAVEAMGKNLLIRFDNGLEIRTHLRMNGSWHRYRPGERWRRAPGRARLILEVPGTIAVCFDAPVVELFESRAEALHPALATLGPDVLADDFDAAEAIRRLRDPSRAGLSIAEALLDQRALAGIGNVWKCEVLFAERTSPFVPMRHLDDATLERLVSAASRMMRASLAVPVTVGRTGGDERGSGGRLRVYERAGRPCPRCGTLIRSISQGTELPRTTYWCPNCQADPA
jgi:endonuclease-8